MQSVINPWEFARKFGGNSYLLGANSSGFVQGNRRLGEKIIG
jgi:hypothetical protein